MSNDAQVSIFNLYIHSCSFSLPSSSNDVRAHRQLLGIHHAPSPYRSDCTYRCRYLHRLPTQSFVESCSFLAIVRRTPQHSDVRTNAPRAF